MASKKSRKSAPPKNPLASLKKLGKGGKTGALHVQTPTWGQADVYLMMGSIIACGSVEDDARLGRILIASGAVSPEALKVVVRECAAEDDLADLLVRAGAVAGDVMMAARTVLFQDNLAWSVAIPADSTFEEMDAVFPPNMQLGLDRDSLLDDIATWRDGVQGVLDLVSNKETYAVSGDCPDGVGDELWQTLQAPRTVAAILDEIGPPLREAAQSVAAWLADGVLDQVDEDDHARAARGEFIKSYDVLDKVDLRGVEVIGAAEVEQPSAVSLEAIEAIAMDDDDDGSGDFAVEADGDVEEDDEPTHAGGIIGDTRPDQAVVPGAMDVPSSDLRSGDFDIFNDADDEADELAVVDESGTGITVAVNESTFTRSQLNDFEHRINVFNNIFRVIFGTFAEHITEAKSLQRFNALLGSGQRQYPELFKDLAVETDGTVRPAPLINNLAECPPGDYAALLHQGLYELIFSHLYDAKDMLPGDAESSMMERIVVFERQLHQM